MSSSAERGRDALVTIYPDGPILVRGDVELQQADGTPLPCRRRTVALCRCGSSGLMPFCDGTHKVVWDPTRRTGRARQAAEES